MIRCLALLLTACALWAIEPSASAPAFTLTSATGASVSLADHRGKVVVLEWVNYDCPFVKKHYGAAGNMPALQREWTGKGVVWLSICSSAAGKQGHFTGQALTSRIAAEGASPTAYLIDADGTVGRAYAARNTPYMVIIAADGTVAYAGAIDSIRSTKAEDVAKATNHVAVALGELMAGKPVTTAKTAAYGCSVKY